MRVAFEDLVGRHIKHYGQESVYVCQACGKPKLWHNELTGLFQCFACGVSGCVQGGFSVPQQSLKHEQLEGDDHFQKFRELARRHIEPIAMVAGLADRGITRETAERFDVFPLVDGMGFPMYLGGRMVGYQAYRPDNSKERYKNYGQRGIGPACITHYKHVILCEGIFDALSLFEVLPNNLPICVCCTFGNQISRKQLTEILYWSSVRSPIFIAFDADKPSELAQACCMLKPYRRVVATPPTSRPLSTWGLETTKCKDWDESVRKHPQAAIDYWKDIFERHA